MSTASPGSLAGAGRPKRRRLLDLARIVFAVLVLVALALALAGSWRDVRTRVVHAPLADLLGSLGLALLALACSGLAWLATLRGFGVEVSARRASPVVFVGQLGKYLPGSVWAVVAQMELGRRAALPRPQVAAAYSVSLLVNVVSGALVSLACLPWLVAGAGAYVWALAVLPLGLLLLHPAVLRWLIDLGLRITRRAPMSAALSGRAITRVAAWSLAAWLAYGAQALLLTSGLARVGFGRVIPLVVGGYALASIAGLLFIIAPAGAGVREAVLFGLLTLIVVPGAATAVALVSRLVVTVADLLMALGALLVVRGQTARTSASAGGGDGAFPDPS